MKVEFDESFLKSLNRIKDRRVKSRIKKVIQNLEKAPKIDAFPQTKKLSGFKNFYRIRIGDYRLGFELIDKKIILVIIAAHRKEIYRKFPK